MQVALGTTTATTPGRLELPRPASSATSLERSVCVISLGWPEPPPRDQLPWEGGPCHLTRSSAISPGPRKPRRQAARATLETQSSLGDLCHLTGSPVSLVQITRAASPELPAPRGSRRPGASRLRASPQLHAQPAWLVAFGAGQRPHTRSGCKSVGLDATATSPPSLWFLPLFPERPCPRSRQPCAIAPPAGRMPARPLRKWTLCPKAFPRKGWRGGGGSSQPGKNLHLSGHSVGPFNLETHSF